MNMHMLCLHLGFTYGFVLGTHGPLFLWVAETVILYNHMEWKTTYAGDQKLQHGLFFNLGKI